jgi:hypothetical protein
MIVLVNYAFTTGENEYRESKLVSVRFEDRPTDQDVRMFAEDSVQKWFPTIYPESKLDHVMASMPLEVTFTPGKRPKTRLNSEDLRALRLFKEDGYSANMSFDNIYQLVEETGPYTDRLVLNGLAEYSTIEAFEDLGCYVNTMRDESDGSNYTVIKWSK